MRNDRAYVHLGKREGKIKKKKQKYINANRIIRFQVCTLKLRAALHELSAINNIVKSIRQELIQTTQETSGAHGVAYLVLINFNSIIPVFTRDHWKREGKRDRETGKERDRNREMKGLPINLSINLGNMFS